MFWLSDLWFDGLGPRPGWTGCMERRVLGMGRLLSCPLKSLFIRLGGFHFLLSFLGAVSHIMAGSGLEEAWMLVYAKNSILQMMRGKAYSRAICALFLTQEALVAVFIETHNFDVNKEELKALCALLTSWEIGPDEKVGSTEVKKLVNALEDQLQKYREQDRTQKLWIHLIEMDIKIEDFKKLFVSPSLADLIWLYGNWKGVPGIAGWSGFMEQTTSGLPCDTTFVACLSFIKVPPSDYNTIYTALVTSIEQCKSMNEQAAANTFDQPLYLKARFIIACPQEGSDFANLIIRIAKASFVGGQKDDFPSKYLRRNGEDVWGSIYQFGTTRGDERSRD
ncbi:hypothetical protein ILUMI_20218 [Ignelater luminosus]|uniref:Uncharacterized protein n=1 Tax=Ignelater luminosus TaxID=2038154 RepID=A0A8K0CEP4_IGNLU|nr:hypothetical protein ILUMI_20218 [Ignelater luminosus]